jgi:4-amino-4-deoxychorismate lyase
MPGRTEIWLDGERCTALPMPNRGLDFGDGLFETILVRRGQPFFVELHLERLSLGLRALAISNCIEAVRNHLNVAVAATSHDNWAVARISVLRGPGPRGYAPAATSKPRILIYVHSLDSDHATMFPAANVGIADIRLAAQPYLAQIKHLNRLEQVVAATQAQTQGTDECILLDQAGHIVSVIAGNIFLLRDGELLTPSLEACGVAGTRRRLILEQWSHSIGLTVRETKLSLVDLSSADELFYSNSLYTVRPIGKVGQQSWEDHSVCTSLFQQFLNDIS